MISEVIIPIPMNFEDIGTVDLNSNIAEQCSEITDVFSRSMKTIEEPWSLQYDKTNNLV
jgi:hypothetical protein